MAKNNKYKKNQQTDFLRYLKNKMTDKEKNAFERNLQKDPFAEEALMGFDKIDPGKAKEDLLKLEKRLKLRTSGKRIIIWYRIAASVAILMILSSIFIIIERNKPEESLSYSRVPEAPKEIPDQSAQVKPVEKELIEKKAVKSPSPEEKPVANTQKSEIKTTRESETRTEAQSKKAADAIRVAEAVKPDNYAGMKTKGLRAAADSGIGVKPEPSGQALSEVVVVGKGVAGAGYTPAQPVTGNAEFEKYVQANIQRPDTASAGQRVVVVLNFKVNPDGGIDSLKVFRSPSKPFSDEAIRLLRAGPEWKPAQQNGKPITDQVRVRIVFK